MATTWQLPVAADGRRHSRPLTSITQPVLTVTAVDGETLRAALTTPSTSSVPIASYSLEASASEGSGYSELTAAYDGSYDLGGLANSTRRYFRARATDEAGRVGPYSAVKSDETLPAPPPVGGSNRRMSLWLISSIDFAAMSSAQRELVAMHDSVTIHHHPGLSNGVLDTWAEDITERALAQGHPILITLYGNHSEISSTAGAFATLRGLLESFGALGSIVAGAVYGRTSYPNGTIMTVFTATNYAINECTQRLRSGRRLTWVYWNYLLNTLNRRALQFIKGFDHDNARTYSLNSYDRDENGTADSKSGAGFRNALRTAQLQSAEDFYSLAPSDWTVGANGLQSMLMAYILDGIDDRAAWVAMTTGVNRKRRGLIESFYGKANSRGGVWIYVGTSATTPSNWNGVINLETGAVLNSAPPIGTRCKGTFGGFGSGVNYVLGGGNPRVFPMLKLAHECGVHIEDRSQIRIGVLLPAASRTINGTLYSFLGMTQVRKHYRFSVGVGLIVSECSVGATDSNTEYGAAIVVDEQRIPRGPALTGPTVVVGANGDGTHSRLWEGPGSGAVSRVCAFLNPEDNSTARTINPNTTYPPGPGKAWYRPNAALYASQDTAINNGAKQTTGYSLPLADVIFFEEKAA